jgi:hypothetical protein
MEIIWNTTGNDGMSQRTTAAPRWSQKRCPSMAGFSDAGFRGDTVGLRRLAFVMPSLAMPKKTARETRCDWLGLAGGRTSSALRCLAVEAAMACRPHESDVGD